jgi:predicted O-linked N-acetylglucosamine transferase (SPINDLY family)
MCWPNSDGSTRRWRAATRHSLSARTTPPPSAAAALAEALASFDQAIAIKPDFAAAWFGRASALLHDKRYAEAFAAYNQVLTIEPDHYKALAQLAWWYERQGDIKGVLSCYDQALAIKPDFATAIENKIFVLDFAPNVGFVEHQEARKNWWQQIGAKIAAKSQLPHNNSRDPQRRIVLGYVSSDFRKHSAALVTWPVLKHHDQTRFEIVCYSCSTIEDEFTEKFRQMATKWRNASQLSDARLADQIRADNVDILIDLSGHTAGNRLGTFARRPAPIQVTAWGNATGTGLATIDYLFSDPVTVPNDVRRLFAEKIYDLPCALTIEELPTGPSDPPVLANKYVTFGFFNRTSKISDDAVAVWASILGAEHGSRLLIKHFEVEDESVRNLLRGRFAKHGISADRIDFLGSSNRWEHLVAHNNVDICFDPFPQNGGVSTWESLHMGVPVVAMLGNSVSTRIAGAILSSIGMSEWVARSPDEYAAIALKYSSDPDYLKKLRHELPARISASPAGNAAHYTKAVEAAYIAMWEDYCTRRA